VVVYVLSFGTKDVLELLEVRTCQEFRPVLQVWEATTAKWMKIVPYCQQLNRRPLKAFFSHV